MTRVVTANPFRCRVWDLHDRLEGHISEESCSAEIKSVSTSGQLVPALARAIPNNPDVDYELIYGARRLFIARHLNISLLLEVRDMSDHEAVVAMDAENRHRRDISPYERGLSYARWLRSGLFSSQEEICRKIKSSPASVSRALKLASLPSVIVNAFRDATQIREAWGVRLADSLEDPECRRSIIAKARSICASTERRTPEEVYSLLLSASAPGRRVRPRARDEVVVGSSGAPVFRVRYQRSGIAFMVPSDNICTLRLQQLRQLMLDVLQDPPAHSAGDASVMVR